MARSRQTNKAEATTKQVSATESGDRLASIEQAARNDLADAQNLRNLLPDHVLRALFEMGFGRVGIALPEDHFQIRRPGMEWGTSTPEEAAAVAVQQLKSVANAQLVVLKERAAAELPA